MTPDEFRNHHPQMFMRAMDGDLIATVQDPLTPHSLMLLALAAYATYVINATQFLLKLRAARLQQASVPHGAMAGAAS